MKPVEKLSKQRTFAPNLSKASHRLEPINPAPPVTKTVLSFKFENIIYNLASAVIPKTPLTSYTTDLVFNNGFMSKEINSL